MGRGWLGWPTLLVALVAVVVCAAPSRPATAAASHSRCDRYASPSGSNRAPGSRSRPVRSAKRLLHVLRRGRTGCFRGGSYTFKSLRIRKPRVTLRSQPGRHARLRGRIRIEATARGATIEGLSLDGRNRHRFLSPLIYASRATLRRDSITNDHTAICVLIGQYPGHPPPRRVVIERNRIHDCGRLPRTNHDHGIYVDSARGTLIAHNRIYGNADRGIQLYPHARGTRIVSNVIEGNGEGVNFGGDSSGNLVARNLIANSLARFNVSGSGLLAGGNVVRENCMWARGDGGYPGLPVGSGIQPAEIGFTAFDNRVSDPPLPPLKVRFRSLRHCSG